MWINKKEYNKIIDRYEKRIDGLLERLNPKERIIEKKIFVDTDKELQALSRTDEEEWALEQKRMGNLEALEKRSKELKQQIHA